MMLTEIVIFVVTYSVIWLFLVVKWAIHAQRRGLWRMDKKATDAMQSNLASAGVTPNLKLTPRQYRSLLFAGLVRKALGRAFFYALVAYAISLGFEWIFGPAPALWR